MVLQPVIDAWRHTFPKDLRFCRQCIILHAELHSIGRRYRDKKFIPRGEIQGVVDNWADVPYPWMRLRIIRQLALVPIINTVRIRRGEPAWLYTKAVKIEHAKVDAWLSKEANRKLYIPKDQFQREVLDVLHVPATYHYVFIFLASMCFFMFIFLVAAYSAEPLLYLYFRLWRRMSRKEIIDWYEAVALLHCATELPDAYRDSMVPTAFVKPNDDMVYFNVVEMTSPDRDCRIVFIPFPRIAPRTFFKQVGNICRNSQALILEECSLEALQTLPPAYFFPLKDDPFPCLDIHHRYWDILESGDRPPPRLLPGNMPLEWFDKYFQGAIPFPLKVIYFPNSWTGTRADARTGWGRIKEAVQDTSLLSIACPWTPFQITNLKCSLLKEDWKVTRVETLPWMRPRQLGENFCDYYGIKDDELTPAPVASPPEPVVAPVETEKKKRATSGWLGRGQPSSVVNPTVVKAA